jgi:hypothetical protein
VLMKHNWGSRTEFPVSSPFLRLFFVFFERERKAGTTSLSLSDAVGGTSEADERRFMEEPPPRAGSRVLSHNSHNAQFTRVKQKKTLFKCKSTLSPARLVLEDILHQSRPKNRCGWSLFAYGEYKLN